jgi:hypothetical protein
VVRGKGVEERKWKGKKKNGDLREAEYPFIHVVLTKEPPSHNLSH